MDLWEKPGSLEMTYYVFFKHEAEGAGPKLAEKFLGLKSDD